MDRRRHRRRGTGAHPRVDGDYRNADCLRAGHSGTASAAVSLVRKVGVPRFTWIFAAIAALTSALGATAVSLIDEQHANPIIITLLLCVGVFVALKPSFGTVGERRVSSLRIALGCVAVAVIGPGTGMFLIMAFTAVFSQQFLQSAAMAKVVNTATNLGALLVFGFGGYICLLYTSDAADE